MPKAKKVAIKEEAEDIASVNPDCKHQNQGEGKCFDCGVIIN